MWNAFIKFGTCNKLGICETLRQLWNPHDRSESGEAVVSGYYADSTTAVGCE